MRLSQTLSYIAKHPLNKGRFWQALMAYIKWQVGSRLVPGSVVYPWIDKTIAVVKSGETGFTGNIYCGLSNFNEMAYLLHVTQPEDVFVDVGSNVGAYAILACGARGAKGYCFEPVYNTFTRLCLNIKINNLESRVKCINAGGAEKTAVAMFTNTLDSANHVVLKNTSNTITHANMVAIDNILINEPVSIIKIDVEGYELPVVKGALRVLSMTTMHSIIIELNGLCGRYGFNEKDIINIISDIGYLPYSYSPFNRVLTKLCGKNTIKSNTIYIKNIQLILERIKTAKKVIINGFVI